MTPGTKLGLSATDNTSGVSPQAQSGQSSRTIPAGAVLDFWCDELPWTNGVQIEQFSDMQRLLVRTRNSLYEITVMDGWSGEIVVRGGQFFPHATPAWLAGANFGGSILKVRGIYIGFQMEIHAQEGPLLTTRVKMIAVENPTACQKLLF
jgi:hypothetical protein